MPQSVRLALDEHRLRRDRGLPTLSVLCGPPGLAFSEWKAWAGPAGLTVSTPASVERSLLQAVREPLREAAIQRTAAAASVPKGSVLRALESRGADLKALLAALGQSPADESCRQLFETGEISQPFTLLEALELPPVFLAAGPNGLEAGAALASAHPHLHLALPIEDRALLLEVPDTRAKSLAREGLIECARVELEEAERIAGQASASLERLVRDGATAGLVEAFRDAALEPGARSAQESFLFRRLDSLNETAGLFELNGTVRLEERSAEIDLVCRELKLAIEIDGYHHFRDAEAYRRDRRKDLALQRAGYLVLRFLADDVVARLEPILDETLRAVASRTSGDNP